MSKPDLRQDYLVIEGNIGAGKTTLSTLLADRYACKLVLEEFSDNPFLPLFYSDKERYALMVELYFMAERHTQMGPLLSQPTLFPERVLADYVFLKTWLFARQTLKAHELDLFRKLFDQLNAQIPLPQKLLFIHRPVEVLLKNIAKRGRDYEVNITADYLTSIQQTYWDYFREEKRYPIVMVDVGEADFTTDEAVLTRLIDIVNAPANKGLNVVELWPK
ncbi:MAG: deoxynucleoside kinase [Saprospiraceae bacterium]